jgi:hypothetical protein
MNIEGCPPIVRRLYADAIFKTTDYQAAWQAWLEIYNTAEDEKIKRVASNHLYNVKAFAESAASARPGFPSPTLWSRF